MKLKDFLQKAWKKRFCSVVCGWMLGFVGLIELEDLVCRIEGWLYKGRGTTQESDMVISLTNPCRLLM